MQSQLGESTKNLYNGASIKYAVLLHRNPSSIKQKKLVYFVNGLFSNDFVTIKVIQMYLSRIKCVHCATVQ